MASVHSCKAEWRDEEDCSPQPGNDMAVDVYLVLVIDTHMVLFNPEYSDCCELEISSVLAPANRVP